MNLIQMNIKKYLYMDKWGGFYFLGLFWSNIMLEAYGKYVVFKSNELSPTYGVVESVGEDVTGINAGDIIYMMDYAPIVLGSEKEYFAVNQQHILAKNI